MATDERDTWPAPPDGMRIDELSFKSSLALLHQKLDVMGRELMQVRKQVKEIEANLSMTMTEVCRHGRCIAPVLEAEPIGDLAHD
jgi:hypothetical protein